MRAMSFKLLALASIACLSVLAAGCGDLVGQDRSPVLLVVEALEAAPGLSTTYGATLQSDVVTNGSVISDGGRVTLRLELKDVFETPTSNNAVTINRYQVTFRRSDGRNTPGVDVPFPFTSAVTFTLEAGGTAQAGFELIRHVAKAEAPLLGLRNSSVIISTIADVTFFGHTLTGQELSTTGSIGVQFGNFADTP